MPRSSKVGLVLYALGLRPTPDHQMDARAIWVWGRPRPSQLIQNRHRDTEKFISCEKDASQREDRQSLTISRSNLCLEPQHTSDLIMDSLTSFSKTMAYAWKMAKTRPITSGGRHEQCEVSLCTD
ncbi:hypothetical protein PCH_Pc15g01950 [Penicillium rubens Wisconsin 54-1255]|uniref:Uncharacterized protein n=1 Tax=Penicillium rubens (strain ATCC 28089 / DSM 1075 / NRRL 1951 / Wisconsin 54-1255) TaxID=500485 RepID=B6H6D0_PENRW|nr:hypothetical protein PCH_Pc15g01950 [Penicillium rubens Wisconsin 54-1255]